VVVDTTPVASTKASNSAARRNEEGEDTMIIPQLTNRSRAETRNLSKDVHRPAPKSGNPITHLFFGKVKRRLQRTRVLAGEGAQTRVESGTFVCQTRRIPLVFSTERAGIARPGVGTMPSTAAEGAS
jgi:hypothetical protein